MYEHSLFEHSSETKYEQGKQGCKNGLWTVTNEGWVQEERPPLEVYAHSGLVDSATTRYKLKFDAYIIITNEQRRIKQIHIGKKN